MFTYIKTTYSLKSMLDPFIQVLNYHCLLTLDQNFANKNNWITFFKKAKTIQKKIKTTLDCFRKIFCMYPKSVAFALEIIL